MAVSIKQLSAIVSLPRPAEPARVVLAGTAGCGNRALAGTVGFRQQPGGFTITTNSRDIRMSKSKMNRRNFLKASAVGATALSLTAASASRVYGANERIGVAFVGIGGRCQAHLDLILKMQKDNKGVAPVAACHVWECHEDKDYLQPHANT